MAVKKRGEPAAPKSPLAQRILGQRASTDAEVSLERLEAALVGVSRYDVVAALKELEKAGQGHFIAGRRGQKARFVWGAKPSAAAGAGARAAKRPALKGPDRRASGKPEPEPSAAAQPEPEARRAEPSPLGEGLGSGPMRKALVPVSERLERTRLSRGGAEPVSRVTRSLQHSFHLRPGAVVTIELPEDVTPAEVDRFCSFLKALPFAGPRR